MGGAANGLRLPALPDAHALRLRSHKLVADRPSCWPGHPDWELIHSFGLVFRCFLFSSLLFSSLLFSSLLFSSLLFSSLLFSSPLLSSLLLSLPFFLSFFPFAFFLSLPVRCTRGRSLTFTLARVLVTSTNRWARLATHPHQGEYNTSCVVRARMTTLAAQPHHVCHRRETRLTPLARSCSRTPVFLKAPPHLGAPIQLFEDHSRQKTTIQKCGNNFPLRHSCHLFLLQRVFSAPPGASCTVVL